MPSSASMEPIRLPEPCLVVLVGAAGAGKSTFASRWFDDAEILSSDRYRELVSGDPTDQTVSREAFRRLHHALGRRLATSGTAVVDATNVRPDARAALLDHARAAGVPAIAIVLDLPDDEVLDRNGGRAAGVVPEPAVRRHIAELRRSLGGRGLAGEGFDAVHVVTSAADLDGLVVIRGSAPRTRSTR